MITIPSPSDKRFTITNTSNRRGVLWYTKNINFDEEGYIKLSSRAVSLQSEGDDSDFDIPLSYGRTDTGSFLVVTADAPWIMNTDATGLTVQQDTDTGVQTGTFDSWGCWWQNRWYQSTNTGLYYKSGSTWTNTGITATTSGKVHPIAVFANKQTLCIGNGNAVVQINTDHAVSTLAQLTIPADFEVVALSYKTNQMGIATKLSDSATQQNQEAMFFVWDGGTASANGGYPVGSDQILGVTVYKSSWVVLTRTGRVLYFNGGGFDELCVLPYYSLGLSLGESQNRIAHGDVMIVEGDVIYFNISNDINYFNTAEETYIENFPAGIWCYEPRVGLHHRYAPSISKLTSSAVTSGNVNTTTNILTASSAVVPETGSPVVQTYNKSDKIGGLEPNVIYYCIKVTSTEFKLATSRQNAIDAQAIDITAQAAGTSYFMFLNQVDFGTTYSRSRVGGVGIVSRATNVTDHLVFGGEYYGSTDLYAHGCMTVPQFENRGYFVTVKLESSQVEDIFQALIAKFRALESTDTIIWKYKDEEYTGIPVTTTQSADNPQCTWTSSTTFTTTDDLSRALELFDDDVELECEIISGYGAGCMEQITSIEESGGTYTVTLENEIIGGIVGQKCTVIINNYKYLGTMTSSDTRGWKRLPINSNSKWIMLKCELRGVNTTFEQLQLINETHIPAK